MKRSRKTSGISIFQNTEGLFNFLKKARGDRDLKGFDFRGICMYRTSAFRDLILKGIPSSVRQEIWMLTSGAINEVGRNPIKKNISFQSTFSPPQLATNPNYYSKLVADSKGKLAAVGDEIERDLHR